MLQAFKDLYEILKKDPAISSEVPVIRSLALRTFRWLLAAELIMVLQFYPLKWFMDELGSPQPNTDRLLIYSAIMFVVFTIGTMVNRFRANFRSDADFRLWRAWWGYGHRSEVRLSSDFHKKFGTGEKESMVGKNIYKFERMVDEFLFETLPATLRIVFATILMFFLGWQFGLVALVTVFAFGLVLWRNEKIVRPYRKDMQRGFKKLERFGTQMTNNVQTIKSLGLEESFSDKNDQMLLDFITEQKQRTRIFSGMEAMQSHVISVSRAALYGLIALEFAGGDSLGTIVLATMIMERALYISFQRYSNFQSTMNEGIEALKELIWLITLKPSVRQASHPVFPKNFTPEIVFDSVSFAYSDDPDCLKLKDFSLILPANTTTALTGKSGGGKSTVASLVLRDSDPTNGNVLVSGENLRKFDYHRYRSEVVSVVSQAIQLFDDTILENIRLGAPWATDNECIDAAKAAHAHEFIAELKDGYSTMIGENGIRLSGGQRQRLAIARALVRKPLILVLDEATSALDAESQAIIQMTLDELTASRKLTILVIAHRLSTIRGADQIAVMEDGRLVELGTHAELEKLDGIYSRLIKVEADDLLG